MALALTPEVGIEIPENVSYTDLCIRAEAACETVKELEAHGLLVSPSDQDNDVSSMTPASLVQTHAILKEFGQLIAVHAAEIRNMVVNKLILETESPKDSTRMQALINLGKMTDVGLFTDRKEITVTHHNSAELKQKLRDKLEVLKKNTDGVYEAVSEAVSEGQ